MPGFFFHGARFTTFGLLTFSVAQPLRAQQALPVPAATPSPPLSSAPAMRRSSATLPLATATRTWSPFRLIIPGIGLDTLVVRGVDDKTLRAGPGHDPLSDGPGEKGNCIIAAHRNVHGAPFWYLPQLTPNALVLLQSQDQTLVYKVAYARVVPESETDVLERPTHPLAAPRLTLYTCTLPKSTNRFIVVANLIERQPPSTLPLNRKAIFPTVTSGPLQLLKDPELRQRLHLPPLPPKTKPILESKIGHSKAAR